MSWLGSYFISSEDQFSGDVKPASGMSSRGLNRIGRIRGIVVTLCEGVGVYVGDQRTSNGILNGTGVVPG